VSTTFRLLAWVFRVPPSISMLYQHAPANVQKTRKEMP